MNTPLGLNQVRQRYLDFFSAEPRAHSVIPAAPMVLDNDPTTLFTSSGMQPLVPYLKGQPHSMGQRLVNSQPSFRAEDIEEVGDNRHTTFFEMLGNWSLGDYFKQDQLPWIFSFLTQELKLDPSRLYATVFQGDQTISPDEESVQIWQQLFNTTKPARDGEVGFDPQVKIYRYEARKNWWSRSGVPDQMPAGEIGGPDSEIFFDFDPEDQLRLHQQSSFASQPCHVNCDCGRFMEIGNSVFIQYIRSQTGAFDQLPAQNVDFGGGLERITAALADNPDVFAIDVFAPVIEFLSQHAPTSYATTPAPFRVIADHLRAALFMIDASTLPSNKAQGYILRRLLRRATLKAQQIEIPSQDVVEVFNQVCQQYVSYYQPTYLQTIAISQLSDVIRDEVTKFQRVLHQGLKAINKLKNLDAKIAFDLLQSHGFPWELTLEIAQERGIKLDVNRFKQEFAAHQERSRSSSKGMFKGGLADHSEEIVKYHTATHLLHQALHDVLGNHVVQMGSNITGERLRFDFKHPHKVTPEQIQEIEQLINQKIATNLPVHHTQEPKDQALASGARAFFKETYPDTVSVYTIGLDPQTSWYSKELCGGPHVASTGQIGAVTIKKEQAVAAGVRRMYLTFA